VILQVRQSKKGLSDFNQSEIAPDSVPYKDKAREKQRQKELRKAQKAGRDRESMKVIRKAERERAAAVAAAKDAEKKLPAAKRQLLQRRDDLDSLADDYRLYRKLKKGKISEGEYAEAMNIDE
jgi:ATP-dependent RNA helicase DDX55/SPB4